MTLVLSAEAAPRQVWLAMADDGGAYVEAVAVLKTELGGEFEVSSGVWTTLVDTSKPPPDLIVTVGAAAFDGTLDRLSKKEAAWTKVPLLATLIPQAFFEARQSTSVIGSRPFSAVVLDQPLSRQLAAVRRTFPDFKRIGILVGPQTQLQLGLLQKEAAAQGLTLVPSSPIGNADNLYPALKAVLPDAQLLLALPDATIYNAANLQNILLTMYRARVPLVAFSAAYVKAGAVLAVYATPAQVARRAAEMVRAWSTGRGLGAPQSAREFAVATNAKVAASLGLNCDDAAQIAEDLRRQEAGR